MQLGGNRLLRSAGCVAAGCILLVIEWASYSGHATARQRLDQWPHVVARVLHIDALGRTDRDGKPIEIPRSMLAFALADGSPGRAYVFDGSHSVGDQITICYDPSLSYLERPYPGTEVATEKTLQHSAEPENRSLALFLLAGIALVGYGGVGLHRQIKLHGFREPLKAVIRAPRTNKAPPPAVPSSRASGRWTPPPGMVNHRGVPVSPESDFFSPPPPEIGPVISAHTTLIRHRPPSTVIRLGLILGLGVCPTAVIAWECRKYPAELFVVVAALCAALFLFAVIFAILITQFVHTASYVGALGVAKFTLKQKRTNTPFQQSLQFKDAACLWVDIAKDIHLQRVNYEYEWRDRAENVLYKTEGQYWIRPFRSSDIHFARAAEQAWVNFFLRAVESHVQKPGYVQWNIQGNDWIRVWAGYLDFCGDGVVERWTADDLKSVRLARGRFTITRNHTARLTSRRNYTIAYRDVPNAGALLPMIARWVKVTDLEG